MSGERGVLDLDSHLEDLDVAVEGRVSFAHVEPMLVSCFVVVTHYAAESFTAFDVFLDDAGWVQCC